MAQCPTFSSSEIIYVCVVPAAELGLVQQNDLGLLYRTCFHSSLICL